MSKQKEKDVDSKEKDIKNVALTQKERIAKFLGKSKNLGPLTATLAASKLANIDEWLSTGSYSLNKILSGDINKGLPKSRMMALAGLPGTGKTYICLNMCREAIKAGWVVFYIDTENALEKKSTVSFGIDPDCFIHIPVITITDLRNKLVKMMEEFKTDNPDAKIFIVIDSIGNLITEKVYEDIEKDKSAQDMGLRAKQLRDLARILTHEVAKHGAALIATNHIYTNPAQNPNAAPEVVFGGGNGFIYATSGIVFLRKSGVNEEQEDAMGETVKRKTGIILKCKTEKNRFVPEGMSGEIYLDFNIGMQRYYGLLEDAFAAGLIKEANNQWYEIVKTGEKVRKSQIYKKEIWIPLLTDLSNFIKEKYKYASFKENEDFIIDTETEKTKLSDVTLTPRLEEQNKQ